MSSQAVEIYMEQTPNPQSIKFLTSKVLLPNIVFESTRKDLKDCKSNLAISIYEKFDYVCGVFISNNFITISKDNQTEWYEHFNEVKQFLKMYLETGLEVISKDFIESKLIKSDNADNSIEGKIKDLLEKYVQPAVQNDGGSIVFKSFNDGKVLLDASQI